MPNPTFAIIGLGYVSPKHLRAIREVGGRVLVACDYRDNVGFLDKWAEDYEITHDPSEFFELVAERRVEWTAVCTPNACHVKHTRAALRAGSNVIVEKPAALTSGDVLELVRCASEFGGQVYPVNQLRHHPRIKELKRRYEATCKNHAVEIDYRAFRGPWYDASWKGDPRLSGGVLVNLGIHLFDLCCYLWGPARTASTCTVGAREARGHSVFARAGVRWRLSSTDRETTRTLSVGGARIDLGSGDLPVDLHVEVYRAALAGEGVPLGEAAEALRAIEVVRDQARETL